MSSKINHSATMRSHVFTVTTPTQQLNDVDYMQQIIQPHTNYQLIPSALIISYGGDQIIRSALKNSKNKLVDITLPLILADSNGNQINYFGRYLLYNQRLIGIKLSSSPNEQMYINGDFKKWKTGKIIKYKIPRAIASYYRQSRFQEGTFSNQIIVGDFILTVGHIKICLLFESQIQESQSTLFQYKKQGCQIFSIVCDVPKESSFQQSLTINTAKINTKIQNMLKRFAKQNSRLLLYAGVRMATTRGLFLANSFIFHPTLNQRIIDPFFFSDAISLSVLCKMDFIKKVDCTISRRQKANKIKPQLLADAPFISLISQVSDGASNKFYTNCIKQTKTFAKQHGDFLKKLQLWTIFKADNRKKPFIIPLPLSQKMNIIVSQIKMLSDFVGLPIEDFIIFYNKDRSQLNKEKQQQVEVYNDLEQLYAKCKDPILNIYTDDQQHYHYLLNKTHKDHRIRLYYDYINFNQQKQRKFVKKTNNKLQDFVSHVIRNNIVGYLKILAQARSQLWNLNSYEQVEAIAVHLVDRLRRNVIDDPFYKSLLNKSKEQIQQALAEAEIKLVTNPELSLAFENRIQSSRMDQQVSVQSSEKQKQFMGKMKQMKKSQAKQFKKLHLVCHSCKIVFEKEYFYRCNVCKSETCFLCSSENTEKKDAKSRKQFMESLRCIVCRKICTCVECHNKSKKPQQSLNFSTTTLKMADISNNSSILALQEEIHKKQSQQHHQSCTICMINDRKGGKIKVACSTCQRQVCLTCIRNQGGAYTVFTPEWQCVQCKPQIRIPAPELMIDQKQEINQKKGVQVEERQPSVSKSRSNSPKNTSNFKNNQNNRPFYNKNNNNQRPYQDNRNNNFVRNNDRGNNERGRSKMIDENEDKKSSRSLSRSNSIPKKAKIFKKDSNDNQQNKNANKSTENNKQKQERSVSITPQKNKERKLSNSASPPHKARKRSSSGSGSRTPPKPNNNRKRSVSRSNSGSRSRSKQRNNRERDNSSTSFKAGYQNPQKLWGNKNNSNNNNNNNQRYGNNRGGRGGNRGRGGFDRGDRGDNRRGGYNGGNNGGYNGGYKNNRDDRNNREDRNYRDNRDNKSRDVEQEDKKKNQSNQIVVSNYESNNDLDY